ncbi:MAG TPA: HIT family protein [Candidatus Nanoarchaeia archaeon]|nr:HIT family protein [Candidatus Nanoarchaeia archaeon]
MSCIFCSIVQGKMPCSLVYEDGRFLAFLDVGPVHKGHTILIPKQHHETYLDIPDETLRELAVALKKVAGAVKKAVGADGLNLGMNLYPASGQSVPHAHWHIMPRFLGDGLQLFPQGRYEEGEMARFQERIRQHL